MKKGFISGFICATIFTTGLVFASNALSEVYTSTFPIKINGQAYNPEMPILNYQGRTYLALREFGTVTGNTIDFQNNTIIVNTKDFVPTNTSNETQKTPTLGEKNALAKAKSYLSIMAYSRDGLIKQLEFEKFSNDEAIYGVDNCGANWNEQAAKKAKSYLDIMSYSRDGLIKQLEFEGFTHSQAEYGVSAVGY